MVGVDVRQDRLKRLNNHLQLTGIAATKSKQSHRQLCAISHACLLRILAVRAIKKLKHRDKRTTLSSWSDAAGAESLDEPFGQRDDFVVRKLWDENVERAYQRQLLAQCRS